MARPKRFELLTPRFVVWCSIQLSYGRLLRGTDAPAQRAIAIAQASYWQGILRLRSRALRAMRFQINHLIGNGELECGANRAFDQPDLATMSVDQFSRDGEAEA